MLFDFFPFLCKDICQTPYDPSNWYWTGAAPEATVIRDISSAGLYLLTKERWYPGTVVRMTLQRTDGEKETSDCSIVVEARVIWSDTDGVSLAFVLPTTRNQRGKYWKQDTVTNKKNLEHFLSQLS